MIALPWIGFTAAVLVVLAIDLGVFNRKAHAVTVKAAASWSALWISLALMFAAGVFHFKGSQAGVEFLTGYLLEYSLSVDNIFIFVLIFSYFGVKDEYQHRVLFWGIIGALVMRGIMIALGAALLERFHWIIYVFGAFLVVTGIKMARSNDEQIDPESNPIIRLVCRFIPLTNKHHGQKFFVKETTPEGVTRRLATPLFLVLVLIETMDLVFAVDSIPAVFSITRDPFIVYTSNVCAILGLRSLYFLLAGIIGRFHYLKYGLAVVLSYVGVKMLISGWYKIPTLLSLGVIFLVLGTAVVVSLLYPAAEAGELGAEAPHLVSDEEARREDAEMERRDAEARHPNG